VFLGSYRFDGDPDELLRAYRRLVAAMPAQQFILHVCVQGETGITVLDSCPSREVFDGFTSGPEFAEAVAASGLPEPSIQPLGDVVNMLGSTLRG